MNLDDLDMDVNKIAGSPYQGPSVLECQLEICQKWHEKWTESNKDNFIQHLNESDPDFVCYIKRLSSGQQIEFTHLPADTCSWPWLE